MKRLDYSRASGGGVPSWQTAGYQEDMLFKDTEILCS